MGVIAGKLFGGFQSDIPPEYLHYGWVIWGAAYITSAMIDMLAEKIQQDIS